MIIVVAAILAILSVPLTGRSLKPLGHLSIHRSWVVWASIVLQVLITSIPEFPATLGGVLHIVSFGLAAIFMWSNRHLPGAAVIAAGGLSNLIAIAANGGTMPASEWAWRTAGFAPPTDSFGNSSLVQSARVPWMGDVLAVPANWPLSNVFSIGDVAIIVGLTYLVHRTCRSRPAPSGIAALPREARAILSTLNELVLCQERVNGLIDELGEWLVADAVALSRLRGATDSSPLRELLASQSLLPSISEQAYSSRASKAAKAAKAPAASTASKASLASTASLDWLDAEIESFLVSN